MVGVVMVLSFEEKCYRDGLSKVELSLHLCKLRLERLRKKGCGKVNVIEDTDDEDVISVIVEVSEDEDKEIENNKALKLFSDKVKLEKNEELVDIKIIDLKKITRTNITFLYQFIYYMSIIFLSSGFPNMMRPHWVRYFLLHYIHFHSYLLKSLHILNLPIHNLSSLILPCSVTFPIFH